MLLLVLLWLLLSFDLFLLILACASIFVANIVDDNEGEHESRDLEPGAGAPPAQQVAVPPLPPLPLRPVPPLANASVNPPQRPQPRAVVPQSRPSQVASVAHRQPPTTTASVSVSATSTRNPYASSSSSGLLGSTTSNPYQTNRSQTVSTTAAQMPLQRPPLTNTNGGGGTTGSCTPVDIEDMMMMSLDSNSSANSKKKRRTDQVVASRAAVRPRPETGMAASVSSAMTAPYASSNGSAPISFAELRSRLVQARENEALYCSMFGQSFLVQARQKGGKLGFNIEKVKSSKDGKKVKKVRIDCQCWCLYRSCRWMFRSPSLLVFDYCTVRLPHVCSVSGRLWSRGIGHVQDLQRDTGAFLLSSAST